ncbi:replication endonuclease [Pseudoduganella aquatica]|uniref:replication endonuclease n=1 Tax=Pseudoduganella aquatica TaxID=2660641 RepID=UPI001E5DD443|nr:replication endonuclease [Pseudoduganella aquatica]
MPVIQQENGRKTVAGLPLRWGIRAYTELTAARAGQILGDMPARYKELSALLDRVTSAPLPLDSTDAQLCIAAERRANECASVTAMIHDTAALRARLAWMVVNAGLEPPRVADDRQFMLRCVDPAWWRRNLRRVHGRTFEHAAIRLGFVSIRAGAYASNETVQRRQAQNLRNARALAATNMVNEAGDLFTLAELAARGVGNKAIRRGELMLRMAGCEAIAQTLGHVGVFVTLTAPSKYHAVLAKSGTINPNYNGATPREAQAALMDVWACVRAKNHRDGLAPYGFRIAEPHHDGCPHWHLLLFVPAAQVTRLQRNLRAYALAEDRDEPGAARNRIKIVRIEADKGSAVGYIAKYVAKNIDDAHLGEHIDADGNVIAADLVGDQIIQPCQRVEAWASAWGIRQFQAVGQPPVTVWRELRRVAAEQVADAPEHVRAAWAACQRVTTTDAETGEVIVEQAADFAAYINAQGGVNQGRAYRIGLAARTEMREGRYGLALRPAPVGIFCKTMPDAVFASTRHQWQRCGAAAISRPWSSVNNCTQALAVAAPFWEVDAPWPVEIAPHDDSEYFASFDFAYFDTPEYQNHHPKEKTW